MLLKRPSFLEVALRCAFQVRHGAGDLLEEAFGPTLDDHDDIGLSTHCVDNDHRTPLARHTPSAVFHNAVPRVKGFKIGFHRGQTRPAFTTLRYKVVNAGLTPIPTRSGK